MVAKVQAQDSVTGSDGLGLFLIEVNAPGLTATEIHVEIVSPERQFTLFLDDVNVPFEAVVGEPGLGIDALFTGLNPERIASAALLNGIARYALNKGAKYASERVVWDVPIGAHQSIAHPLALSRVNFAATFGRLERSPWTSSRSLSPSRASPPRSSPFPREKQRVQHHWVPATKPPQLWLMFLSRSEWCGC